MQYVSNTPKQFDKGIMVHDGPAGGYNWPLSQHREYYTLNVLGTGALTHEQYCKEFPLAAAALAESDEKQRQYDAIMGDPEKARQLHEVITHLLAGKPVALAEAFPMQQAAPMQPPMQAQAQPPMQSPQTAQNPAAPMQQGMDMHTHQCDGVDQDGNGQTDAGPDGHLHAIRGNQILAQNGHTHDYNQMKQAGADGQPPMQKSTMPPQGGM